MQEEEFDRGPEQEPVKKKEKKKRGKKKWILISVAAVLLILTGAMLIYLLTYYHADPSALQAGISTVRRRRMRWSSTRGEELRKQPMRPCFTFWRSGEWMSAL